ncbi:MAG: phosphotransferase [Pseudonocardiaceae bacterium]
MTDHRKYHDKTLLFALAARAEVRKCPSSDWEFVKRRTAADGAVWRSADGLLYKRTGDTSIDAEARFQRLVAALGYPVPEVVETGQVDGVHYVVERSAGSASLHDLALANDDGQLGEDVLHTAVEVSVRLLTAQAHNPLPCGPEPAREWFAHAGFAGNVFTENPDLDTPRVHAAVRRALCRLDDVPMCRSHLDYGLPNVFPGGVIDLQHHGVAPLGYDVYPLLEIVAFKGGNRGYEVTAEQRTRYLAALDAAGSRLTGRPLGGYLGEFLLVKCFFFLALMRPSDPGRRDKYLKWRYRRTLFERGLDQYESSGAIHTDTFPTLAAFSDRFTQSTAGHP